MLKSCKEATRLMSEQMDHPLPFKKWALLQFHIAMCAGCKLFGRQIKALSKIFCHCPEDSYKNYITLPSGLSEESKERMKSLMRR